MKQILLVLLIITNVIRATDIGTRKLTLFGPNGYIELYANYKKAIQSKDNKKAEDIIKSISDALKNEKDPFNLAVLNELGLTLENTQQTLSKASLIEQYIPKNILSKMTPYQVNLYERLINKEKELGSDNTYIQFQVNFQLKQDRLLTDQKKEEEKQEYEIKTVFLEKYTQGGACTYNMISDAQDIIDALGQKGSVSSADLSATCNSDLMKQAQKFMSFEHALAPDDEAIVKLLKDIRFDNTYTILDLQSAKQGAKIENLDLSNTVLGVTTIKESIDELFNPPFGLFGFTGIVFFVGTSGHWFVVVADKKDNKITLYLSDRDSNGKMSQNNEDAIKVIKRFITDYKPKK